MKRKGDGLSQLFIGWAYAFVLIMLMAVIMYPKVPLFEVLLMSLVSYALIDLIFINRIVACIFLILATLGSLFVTYICWVETSVSKPVLMVVESIITQWYCIVNNVAIPENIDVLLNARVFMVLTAVMASVLVVFLFKKHFSLIILTGMTAGMFIFSWFMTAIESKLLFLIFCILTVLSYLRYIYNKKNKLGLVNEKLPMGNFMLAAIPFALVPVIAVSLIPKNKEPIQWAWLDNKIMKAIDDFELNYSTTNMEYFSLSSTGFSGRPQRLGGPVRPNNIVVMDVTTDKRTYLRGAAYLDYVDNSWTKPANNLGNPEISLKNPASSLENDNEVLETRTGWANIPVDKMFSDINEDDKLLLTKLSEGSLEELMFPTYSMEVRFRKLTTRTVFMPLKSIMPVKNKINEALNVFEDIFGAATADEKLPAGSTYKLDYMQPMYGEPMLKKALTYSRRDLYKDALDALNKERQDYLDAYYLLISGKSSNKNITFDSNYLDSLETKINQMAQFYNRAKSIEESYTRLNDTVPQRVRDLALNLTKDGKNDYEKAVLIEKYLRENFTYTLNASYAPEGQDFVDYFLFGEKKGYCTYYATSMAVMLRSLGIPARYVEGYVLPPDSNEDGVFTITNKSAHAWTEVYFEGFGWLTFEPTSIYADTMNYTNEILSTDAAAYPYSPEIEDLRDRFGMRDDNFDYKPSNHPKGDSGSTLLLVGLIFAGLIVSSILLNLSVGLINKMKLRWLKSRKKVIRMYEIILKWLKLIDFTIKPGETVGEFSRRVHNIYIYLDPSLKSVTDIFVKVRYGDYEASLEEVRLIERFLSELRKLVLKELGIKRFIPLRNILLGI